MKYFARVKGNRGAVAPLVAIMLILIVVCVALVVDLGHVHNVKVQLQRAVDAAALAGAQELTGASGASTNARNVAVATALANTVDQEQVVIDPNAVVNPDFKSQAIVAVQPIQWNPNIVNPSSGAALATNDRITPLNAADYDNANGLWVTAQRNVNHVFFFFTGSTQVTADAIAVATPELPVLPLAIVTCIPAEQMLEHPGTLPDPTVCGITSFSFTKDTNDTAAWTSLSYTPNATTIKDFMGNAGQIEFNKVVFGIGITGDGIENEPVDSNIAPFSSNYLGCPSNFPPIDGIPTCGLGKIPGVNNIASPAEFEAIAPATPALTQGAQGVYQANLPFDPLTAYAINGSLPRWYNINPASGFQDKDHFTRVWSQDGILLKASGETYTDYIARLGTYANCTDTTVSPCNPYGDDRFKIIGNTENFIVQPSGQFRNNLRDSTGLALSAIDYWPDFRKVVKHAGYPKVGVINGSVTDVIKTFIENPQIATGGNLRCSDNDPFPAGQKTLRVNAPVIFAGACEDWKAISNPSPENGFTYVGLSKLLITRVWAKGVTSDHDCGDDSDAVQLNSGAGCDSSAFDPGLFNGTYFSLPAQSPPAPGNLMAFEGLTLVPIADDEEDQGSLLNVYLVE